CEDFLLGKELRFFVVSDHLIEAGFRCFIRQTASCGYRNGCYAARVNEPLDARLPRLINKAECRSDVALINIIRGSGPQPVIGGNVEDLPDTLQSLFQRSRLPEIARNALDIEEVD